MITLPAALEIRDFGYAYPDGTTALKGIDLTVQVGESLAVIGPNGAGKSTLLLGMMGILDSQGTIRVFGEPMRRDNVRALRRKLALVFQDPNDQLFMPALEEDVAFGPLNLGLGAEEVERRVNAALRRVNLLDFRRKPPHHLSYGEKRRAALATALAMEPEILLLDEPTSNLDPATRRELMDYLAALTSTRVISTHDLDLAAGLCSRCALLSAGRLIACGDTADLLADRALLREHRLAP